MMPYPPARAHKVLIFYEGCDEPEIWDLPPGHKLRVGPIGEGPRMVAVEVWETPEYNAGRAEGWTQQETWVPVQAASEAN